MSVVEVPVQIRVADLLRAIERLSPAEFGVVAARVADLQRTQQAHADLLAQARRTLPKEQQRRLKMLAAKAEAETISDAERNELLELSEAAEQLDAERAESLRILSEPGAFLKLTFRRGAHHSASSRGRHAVGKPGL